MVFKLIVKKAILSILALLLLTFTGCDKAYPPVVVNASSSSVVITIKYFGDKLPFSGTLPKGSTFFHRQPDLKVKEISVESNSGDKKFYASSELNNLRSTTQDKASIEIWILSESGIRLGTKDDLQKLMHGGQW